MKFDYKITKADKSSEILRAMSFKKVLKQIALKYPNETITLEYLNKKENYQIKTIIKGKYKNDY